MKIIFPMRPAVVRRTSGMVLVLALFALAVMMILLLALFHGTSHQLHGEQSDSSIAREKMLADSAVALVIGQIQQASTTPGQAWISQPGLLRTYTTSSRTPTACYKLYSTPQLNGMIDTSGNLGFLATDIPVNWSSLPSQYTDLNASVKTPGWSSQTLYPILDAEALTSAANQSAGTQVEGISSDPGHSVEMPVAWLYQLQDGTLGPASNGTSVNPIVARVAFWTDDDTCKININTAGCGSPWNTPRTNSSADVIWSTTQPANGEFSTYPGHPATTSLGVVFGSSSPPLTPQQLLGLTPRYAWGGSEFGAQATTPGEVVTPKTDRLYASVDELCFASGQTSSGQRAPSLISPAQLELTRFVLTAHSQAPETTMLGEPRVAIWPVADSTARTTATDRAIMSAATLGTVPNATDYFFQRNNPQNTLDDFDPKSVASPDLSNISLFNALLARGQVVQPGYGAALSAKYPGANWSQIMLEIVAFIRGLNAIDPNPAIVPFAGGDSSDVGRGFVEPLTMNYTSGTSTATLRGLGRSPTLSSVTLVLYVCGFGFDSTVKMNPIDYEKTPDLDGSSWQNNFTPTSPLWQHVNSELVRAFLVPCTFQPGCGYPEVSDNCSIQMSGMDGLGLTSATSNDFNFAHSAQSDLLSQALKLTPADRAWGGNEGPLPWRASTFDAQQSTSFSYAFAGNQTQNAFVVNLPSAPKYVAGTGLVWPHMPALVLRGAPNLTVLIVDGNNNTLQTLNVDFPANIGIPAPTPTGEYTLDGSSNTVAPSYYMTLKNRILATGANRPFLIQPGDTSRSMEAATDLRVIAGLSNVPASFFQPHPLYKTQADSHAHNLHFADGTAAYGASGITNLISTAPYASATTSLTWTNWQNNLPMTYAWPISPPCSAPTGSTFATMTPVGSTAPPTPNLGDWDTGPGFAPDGAQINLPDSGTSLAPATAYQSLTGGNISAPTQRTPNALVPSPVIFGSLPAGIDPVNPTQSQPWRTLLFCPNPAASAHPGFGNATTAPDHLILDNFWMPVVEPYAISTCMATAGKINLNDQIAPFTYLHRNTMFYALLDDLRIPAIPIASANNYKTSGSSLPTIWNPVDEPATIAQIENKFAANSTDAYLSESEICTVPLVPLGQGSSSVAATQANLASFWATQASLTGDNLRELPYAQLYSRLTTRSNSYTVHVRVQVLQKLPHDPNQNVWNEGVDVVLGDWRGSYEIERYLDPTVAAPTAGNPLKAYKFRIVSSRQFAP
jgi:uncharacterized protein (TIGR02600 family)